ncbi:hypothetical protein [Flaviflagellibacter deserti]|uniref:Uncharacterized protein n=1 Tax=Flaviflagellibacter deserti TaxID=2267266 RepID=A0ABV9YXG9_9HYPH
MSALSDMLSLFWREIADRPDGPFAFRFYLQPVMSALLAFRDGIKDAKGGTPPYFWTILNDAERRSASLMEGLKATARVIGLGFLMDFAYQYFVLAKFTPLETIVVVLLLCFVPYLLLRGPFRRLAGWWLRRQHQERRS